MRLDRIDGQEELLGDRLIGRRRRELRLLVRTAERLEHPALRRRELRHSAAAGGDRRTGVLVLRHPDRDQRLARLDHVAVAKPLASRDARPVEPGPVARQPVVDEGPLGAELLELRVQPRHLGVPAERDVVRRPAPDRHPRLARMEREERLPAGRGAIHEERLTELLRLKPRLELLRRGGVLSQRRGLDRLGPGGHAALILG
ncbi:MAG: hypothetical protein AVDCRST_MAG85-1503 [uncultured Solirubrobacteraceae bacterium]|uniref:Uncharacterized protein n=1 Tax=uncultured Solirubrobacteraceae bacterium TaxID=1162706 RepID=A0A6J4SMW4_9ACTN|nr:MAG: hypothetical protein AVDCRST_MAG85-1503 [uncultured Solirubrobacteraceae bacterium]